MESHRWQQSLVRDVDLLMQHHPTAVAIVIYVVPGAKSVVDILLGGDLLLGEIYSGEKDQVDRCSA
jgi:hypothetical protein